MVFGLLPLFITGQLGASGTLLGLVEGVAEMLGYTVRMTYGTVSDRVHKRKPLVLIGYSPSAATKPIFALFPFLGFAGVFYLSLLPGAIAVVILMFFVKEKLAPPGIKRSVAGKVKDVIAEKRFVALLGIMGLFSAGAFNLAFVLIRASDLGPADGTGCTTWS